MGRSQPYPSKSSWWASSCNHDTRRHHFSDAGDARRYTNGHHHGHSDTQCYRDCYLDTNSTFNYNLGRYRHRASHSNRNWNRHPYCDTNAIALRT